MLLSLGPLRAYPDFRLLFFGQTISLIGSMVTYVAVPFQVFQITQSALHVGLISLAQLGPVVIFGIIGGSAADRSNRRTLLLVSELVMCIAAGFLALNSLRATPSLLAIYVLAFIMAAANAYHRPTIEAIAQKMVHSRDFAAVASLRSFAGTFGSIAGPALGGFLVARYGVVAAYVFDLVTFILAMASVLLFKTHYRAERKSPPPKMIHDIREAFQFAARSPLVMGTYVIDVVAMVSAYPNALFPALAAHWQRNEHLGWLYGAGAFGAFLAATFSGRAAHVSHRGRMVVGGAALWGVAIAMFGIVETFWPAVLLLVVAGAFDMVSAIYRGLIWNETIPNEMRGRMGGLEMISYMIGPLLGNVRAGLMADSYGLKVSIISGGVVCVLAVTATAWRLRALWSPSSRG
jgi:MFS family permease